MQEIEIKFLAIDPESLEKKLLKLGAMKVFDEIFEEWIFAKSEWKSFRGRARVRAQGKEVLVAYKETTKKTSEGNVEIEFVAGSKEHAIAFITKLGIPLLRHQQKRRIHFLLDGVAIDIDFWPMIPPLVEIEGESLAAIEKVAKALGLALKDACELDARQIIRDIYKVDIDEMSEYVF